MKKIFVFVIAILLSISVHFFPAAAQPIGIFLDDELISSPTVYGKITNGEAVITGGMNKNEAEELASKIKVD